MSLFGLGALDALAAMAPGRVGKAKRVILIFNGGAPSHLDLWDPKPDAPSEIRGQFKSITTNVPGTHISELLPRMAKRMDKLALIRSVHHGHSSHNGGMHWSTVGRPYRIDSTLITPSPTDLPCFWHARRMARATRRLQRECAALCHHAVSALRQQGVHHTRPIRRLPRLAP